MITLVAAACFGFGGRQFIARITGRDTKFTFHRWFLGRNEGKRFETTTADVYDAGLYEVRDVDKKGRPYDTYYVVMEIDGETRCSIALGKDMAMKIAKEIDKGRALDTVCHMFQRPGRHDPSRLVWDVELITPRQAETRANAQTLDSAINACWAVLQCLPEREAKKVLAQLRIRVSPPQTAPVTDDAPVGIISDMAQEAGVSEQALGLTLTPVAAGENGPGRDPFPAA